MKPFGGVYRVRGSSSVPRWLLVAAGAVVSVGLGTAIVVGLGRPDVTRLLDDGGQLAAALIAAAGCASAVRRGGSARAAWAVLLASSALWSLGSAAWFVNEIVLGRVAPSPSLADLGYLGSYPVAIVGVILLRRSSGRRRIDLTAALDGAIVVTSLALTSWSLATESISAHSTGGWPAMATTLAYPVEDIAVLSAAVLLWLHAPPQLRSTARLLGLGLAAIAIADTSYAYLLSSGTYSTGVVTDIGWIAGFLLLGIGAATHRPCPVASCSTLQTLPAAWVGWRVVGPVVPLVISLTAWTANTVIGGLDVLDFALALTLIAVVIARQLVALVENQRLTAELAERVRVRTVELDRFRAALDDINEAIYITDLDGPGGLGRFVDTNQAATRMLGYTRAELLEMAPADIVAGADASSPERWRERMSWARGCASGVVFAAEHRRLDGSVVPVEVSMRCQPFDDRNYLVAVARDVSERRAAEALLAAREQSFRLLFGASPHPTFVCDVDTERILAANEAAAATYRYSQDQFLALRWPDLVETGDPMELLTPTAAGGEVREGRHRLSDGRVIDVEVTSRRQDYMGRRAAIILVQDVTERLVLSRTLEHQAFHSPLTDLPNRRLLVERLVAALERQAQHGRPVALLEIDLDGFKAVNDSLGHWAGDEILRKVGARLVELLRSTDTAAHIGGDEFVVLLEDVSDDEATAVGARILAALQLPHLVGSREVFVSASCGLVVTWGGTDAEAMLRDADVAMYAGKNAGRNQLQRFVPEMREGALRRLELGSELRRALERGEFFLEYQPIVSLADAHPEGAEALLRWHHPRHGRVPPGDFISLAEQSGMIIEIGQWVLDEACRQAASWSDHWPPGQGYISVNVSSCQFSDPGFVDGVLRALERSGLCPEQLVLEVTESVLVDDVELVGAHLHRLRGHGIRIAMDDFGAGYSSLAYLRKLPIDIVKIDRLFVAGLADDRGQRSLTSAIAHLLETLDVRTVAEGIELPIQRHYLASLRVHSGQGYLFSRPVSAEAFRAFLDAGPGPTPRWAASTGWSRANADLASQGGVPRGRCRLVIADDNQDMRVLLRSALDLIGGFEVVGEAIDGAAAVAAARRLRPDLLVLDLNMPGTDGRRALPRIRRASSQTKVVVLTAAEPADARREAERLGADGFIAKGTRLNEIIAILRTVASGDASGGPMVALAEVAEATSA